MRGGSEQSRRRSLSRESYFTIKKRTLYTEPNSPTSVDTASESSGQYSDNSSCDLSGETNRNESVASRHGAETRAFIQWIFCILFVVVISVALAYLYPFKRANPNLDVQLAFLQESFPGQSHRLWAVLRSTITTATRFSASLKTDAEVSGSPKVLLISPSADPVKHDSYRQFLNSLKYLLGTLDRQWTCVDIDPFEALYNASPENIKRNMYNQMERAYHGENLCLHMVGIDRLPGDAALALHGTTDPLSSPFRNAFLLFSINQPPKFPNRTSQRAMETHLRRHLRILWEGDLGADEVAALINRLTGRIGIFEV